MKRIAIDLAKSVYQVAESIHVGRVDRRRRLDPEAFWRYVQEQPAPVEWVMEACGTAHHWGAPDAGGGASRGAAASALRAGLSPAQ